MKRLLSLVLLIGLIMGMATMAGSQTTKSATLTWNANTEADLAGYKLYRSNTLCAAATVTTPLVTLGKVITYLDNTIPSTWFVVSYWLTAFDTAAPANESTKSNCVEKTFYTTPATPVLVAGAITSNSLQTSWAAVGGGDGFPAKYDLRYAVAPALSTGGWGSATSAVCSSPTATSCTVPNLLPNTNYEFEIVSYRTTNGSNVYSTLSAVLPMKTAVGDIVPPAAPQGLKVASVDTSGAMLAWDAVPGATGYQMKRLDSASNKWVPFSPPIVTVSTTVRVPLPSTGSRKYQACSRYALGEVCNLRAGVWAGR